MNVILDNDPVFEIYEGCPENERTQYILERILPLT